MNRRIRIGTRGSQLALWQANEAARLLTSAGFEPELVVVRTTGDVRQDVSLAAIGGKGLFIKELEEQLEAGAIDVAVHSLKDVPSLMPEQFSLAAFLQRADPRDAWVHPTGHAIADLSDDAIIGTSAPRRRAQLHAAFPQLRIEDIRGNVDSRIAKARRGQYTGIVLASAGLVRLERSSEITSWFDVDEMTPAAGQGIVALECLGSNERAREAAAAINDPTSAVAATVERGVLQKFGERLDCYSAIAVHCTRELDVRAFVANDEGTRAIRVRRSANNPDDVIDAVYTELVEKGAKELLHRELR